MMQLVANMPITLPEPASFVLQGRAAVRLHESMRIPRSDQLKVLKSDFPISLPRLLPNTNRQV